MEDFKKLVQEANGFLRTAQNNMFSGKNNEAVELMNKAEELYEKAKQQMPNDFQVTSLLQKIEKMRKDLERKGVATRPTTNQQLPFEVTTALANIRNYLVKKNLEGAKREMNSYYSRFAGPMTAIPEIKEMNEHLQKLEAEELALAKQKAAEETEKAHTKQMLEELCRNWEIKLNQIPYFDGTPHNVPGLLEEKEYFQQAISSITELAQIDFRGEKSISIESLEMDINQRIETFSQNFAQTAAHLVNEVAAPIENRIDSLRSDLAWTSDPKQLPDIIGKNVFDSFTERIEEIKPLFADNPEGLANATSAFAKLQEMDKQRRIERSKRIFIKSEAVDSEESKAPKTVATETFSRNYPQSRVLKTAMVKPWEAKRIEEWADNTHTRWITREYHETTIEIAAMLPNENYRLFTLHVEKSMQPDNNFSPLKSHILFDEQMAKENIEQTEFTR